MARQLLNADTFEVKETDLELEIPADPEARYTLRPLTTLAAREIGKKYTRQEFNRQTHRRESIIDQEALNDAIVDYVIVGWSGVSVGAEGPAPCTVENKLKLPVPLQRALLDQAQVGDSAEVRAESFRQPARVVSVLGR